MKMNKKALAGAGLAAVALIGGTFAYYSQTVTLENPLDTGKYNSELIEEFTPLTDEVHPGAEITKEVGAKNTGDYPVLVRIRMDEKWSRDGEADFGVHGSENADFYLAGPEADGFYLAIQQDGEDADIDGVVAGDETVIAKIFAEGTSDRWYYHEADGYWYYKTTLKEHENTGNLLAGIEIASNIDLGHYIQKDYYYIGTADTDQYEIYKPEDEDRPAGAAVWVEYTVTRDETIHEVTGITLPEHVVPELSNGVVTDLNQDGVINAVDMALALGLSDADKMFRKNESLLDQTRKGYADASYTLTVTSQFVQATRDAVLAEWFEGDAGKYEAVMNNLNITAEEDGVYR